jgi:hypothetical protein
MGLGETKKIHVCLESGVKGSHFALSLKKDTASSTLKGLRVCAVVS